MKMFERAAEEAAEKWDKQAPLPVTTRLNVYQIAYAEGFKAGAVWQKQHAKTQQHPAQSTKDNEA